MVLDNSTFLQPWAVLTDNVICVHIQQSLVIVKFQHFTDSDHITMSKLYLVQLKLGQCGHETCTVRVEAF